MDRRGVSPVLGMVLLVGLVAVVALGVLVVGASVTQSTADAVETEQAERAMSEFARTTDLLATGESTSGEFDLGTVPDGATSSTDPDAGRIEVTLARNATSNRTVMNASLGAVHYALDDGTEVVFQAGGVWRVEDGHPVLVRSPNLEYRWGQGPRPAPTLVFPHVRVDSDLADGGDVEGSVRVADERTRYPLDSSLSNPIEGEHLYVTIESQYCEGWERHVEQRTDAEFDERCESNDRLVANMTVGDLPVPGASGTGSGGAIVADEVDVGDWNGNARIDGDVVYSDKVTPNPESNNVEKVMQSGELRKVPDGEQFEFDRFERKLEGHIDAVEDGGENWSTFDSNQVYNSSETHYFEEIHEDGEVIEINASEGPVTIVVRDHIHVSSTKAFLNVTGDHDVTIYAGEWIEFNGGPGVTSGNPDDPASVTIVTGSSRDSDPAFHLTGETEFAGVVVAPSGMAKFDSNDSTVRGAVLADRVELHTAEVEYAADGWPWSVDVWTPGQDPEDLYYLHLSETELEVRS